MTMLRPRAAFVVLVSCLAAGSAVAQPPSIDTMSSLQIAVACAPPPQLYAPPTDAAEVAGAQDTVPRTLFDVGDMLVLKGGTNRHLEVGQQYFLRRGAGFPAAIQPGPRGVQTAGWIRIVAVNESTAIAAVEHACGPILQHDYLMPFAVPEVPDLPAEDDTSGTPDFGNAAHLIFSDEDRPVAAIGEFMLIDHGTKQGAMPGSRMEIYRDVNAASYSPLDMGKQLPLAAVASAVVVSAGPDTALIRIGNARDAVRSGDVAVPRK
jgi:hypothetical protein